MIKVFISVVFLILLYPSVVSAQLIDYTEKPALAIVFDNVHLTLEPDTSFHQVKGVATWYLRKIDQVPDSLSFSLYRGEIHSVRVNEVRVDFSYTKNKLYLPLVSVAPTDSLFKIEITYTAKPAFGVHASTTSLYWSSMLPGAGSDLFPSVQLPSVSVTTDIRLIVPNSWKALANGFAAGTTLLHDDRRLYHWRSTSAIPVVDIAMAFGPMDSHIIRSGDIDIQIFSESGSELPISPTTLLNITSDLLSKAESILQIAYPYESLNLIVLNDHLWEPKTASAGLVKLYLNAGDLEHQLVRGVAAQYFGSFQRSFSLADANHILKYQVRLFTLLNPDIQLPDFDNDYIPHGTPWNQLSPQSWLSVFAWMKEYGDGSRLFQPEQLAKLLSYGSGSFSSIDYLMMLEEDLPRFPTLSDATLQPVQQFSVLYTHDDENQRISIEFIPDSVYNDRYIPVLLRQFSDGTTTDLEFQIGSRGDRISINANGFTNNLYLLNSDKYLRFTEIKPAEFWRFQLRNDADYSKRLEAAEGFGRISDDPDIQLFLQDLIRTEPDEHVRSRLVQSFAQLTRGATGTQQRFITWLTDPSELVRTQAMIALKAYKQNQTAMDAVYRVISTSQDISLVNLAIDTYFSIAPSSEFFATGRGLLVEDQKDLLFTRTILPLIIQTEQGRNFAPNLMQYLESEFPFFIRNVAFEILKDAEISASYWQDLLPILLADSDPRVRYLSVPFLNKIDQDSASTIASELVQNEYDVRVLQQLQELLPNR
jgi:hypothetical protein